MTKLNQCSPKSGRNSSLIRVKTKVNLQSIIHLLNSRPIKAQCFKRIQRFFASCSTRNKVTSRFVSSALVGNPLTCSFVARQMQKQRTAFDARLRCKRESKIISPVKGEAYKLLKSYNGIFYLDLINKKHLFL